MRMLIFTSSYRKKLSHALMVETNKNSNASAAESGIPDTNHTQSIQHLKNQITPSGLSCFLFGNRQKPVIVFLHGFMGSALDWFPVAQVLANDFCCLLVDLPGHGHSCDVLRKDYSMPGCAASLTRLLDELHINKTHIVGYSMGGRIGFYLAVHFPDRFNKIVLESASPGLQSEHERKGRRQRDEALADRLLAEGMEAFLEFWYKLPLFDSLKSHPGFEKLKSRRTANSPEKLAMSLQEMGTGSMPNLWPGLQNITNPVLLLTGEQDKKFRRLNTLVQSEIPNCQHKVVALCGHNVHFEKAKTYTEFIQNFLTDGGTK
ncbi:MAG: 2-succinyl-6-hydroxy-2,4-cyclohexadiene-1-carboxylate synthase [Calditrichaeota bacterium]|nr:MAG: 2-succinyl-6-hydroxy-2,4-cyclohexadiene-1-carboxylate synthase [Calditrichota bacterium]